MRRTLRLFVSTCVAERWVLCGGVQVNKRFPGWCVRPPLIHPQRSPYPPHASLMSLTGRYAGLSGVVAYQHTATSVLWTRELNGEPLARSSPASTVENDSLFACTP